MTVDVASDTELSAAVLEGVNLEMKVQGQAAGTLRDGSVDGTVKVRAGTQIKRRLEVDVSEVRRRRSGLTNVSITWPGLPGASAMIELAPDISEIDVEDMDLSKTQVILATNLGNMTLRFYPDKAPKHAANFVELAKSNFYDGTRFHRVMSGFMIQGGCPNTREGATGRPGTGGPGWSLDAEFNDTRHVRGILSMARSPGDPNSAGSQFFICHAQAPHLDGQYTAFGFLEDGFDTLDRIATVQVGQDAQTPVEPVHVYFAVVLPVEKP